MCLVFAALLWEEMNQLPIFCLNIPSHVVCGWANHLFWTLGSYFAQRFRQACPKDLHHTCLMNIWEELTGRVFNKKLIGPHIKERQQSFSAWVAGNSARATSITLTPLTPNMCMHPSFNLVSWCKGLSMKRYGFEVGVSTEVEEAKCKERDRSNVETIKKRKTRLILVSCVHLINSY
jgi:hypothetical protein